MKRTVSVFILLGFLFNSFALTEAVEPGTSAEPPPRVSLPVYGLLAQAGQLINTVKGLVNNAIILFPQYKPVKKPRAGNDLNPPIMASLFSTLQKPVKSSNSSFFAGQGMFSQIRQGCFEDDVGKPQAPPGAPPGANFLLMFLLLYIISLHRSNLPPVAILLRGRI